MPAARADAIHRDRLLVSFGRCAFVDALVKRGPATAAGREHPLAQNLEAGMRMPRR